MIRNLHTEKFDVFALEVGMYISALDIPWSATEFPLKGFRIRHKNEINKLISLCNHVYVDTVRSETRKTRAIAPVENLNTARIGRVDLVGEKTKPGYGGMSNAQVSARLAAFKTQTYPTVTKFKNEIKVAESILDNAEGSLNRIVEMNQELSNADVLKLTHLTNKMVSSAIRNPDALMWLTKIKNADKKVYSMIISSAVNGIIFARQLGLAVSKIEVLAQSLLFRGIGLNKLPKSVLIKNIPGEETLEYFRHIDLTIETISQFEDCDRLVVNTIQNHCERFDGKGYPTQKPALRIPLLAQMMGIVTFFESLVNPIATKNAISSAEAVSRLFEVGNSQFSKQLIEHFVQSIGLYPVGCLVKLSDESIAMVIDQSPTQRLRPKVAVVKNKYGELLAEPETVDLSNKDEAGDLKISRGVSRYVIPSRYLKLDESVNIPKDKMSRWLAPVKKVAVGKMMSFF